MCQLTPVVCPNHEGGFDCTPFCELCEGEQEYRPKCDNPVVIKTVDEATLATERSN